MSHMTSVGTHRHCTRLDAVDMTVVVTVLEQMPSLTRGICSTVDHRHVISGRTL